MNFPLTARDIPDQRFMFRKEKSIQYHLMAAAAIRTMSEFEEIREDCHRINNNDQTASVKLTSKLKQVRPRCFLLLRVYTCQCWRIYAGARVCLYVTYNAPSDHERNEGRPPGRHLQAEGRDPGSCARPCSSARPKVGCWT